MFSDFCAEIGVDSIREYEQEHLKHQTELDKKRYDEHTLVWGGESCCCPWQSVLGGSSQNRLPI